MAQTSLNSTGVASSGSLALQTNGTTTAVTIDTSQNVGIGTTTPATKLQVAGEIRSNNDISNSSDVTFYSYNGAAAGTVQAGVQFVGSGQNTRFYTNGAERARIDSSGNLLVGTTTTGFSSQSGVSVNAPTAATYMSVAHINGTSTGAAYMGFTYNASTIGSITQNGTTGVLYNLTSDYRLKNDQQPLTGAKEFVMALQPKKWQWWDGSGEGVGFIAHEFMEVAKYSGHGEKDAVDENGNIIAQSIQPSSSEVMANLVALIQEQQALITTLTERITALEAK